MPKVSLDYFFMSQADEKADERREVCQGRGEEGVWRGERNGVAGEGHVRGAEVVVTSGWRWRTHHPQE